VLTQRRDWHPDEQVRSPDRVPIHQNHVELLQVLVLQHAPDAMAFSGQLHAVTEECRLLARDIAEAALMAPFAKVRPTMLPEERRRLVTLSEIQAETQALRNWAYPAQITAIVTGLFATIDDDFARMTGARIAALVAMCDRLTTVIKDRLKEHMAHVDAVHAATTIPDAIAAYFQGFPQFAEDADDLEAVFAGQGATLDAARHMLIMHSDTLLPDVFLLTLNDMIAAYPGVIEPGQLRAILGHWSRRFGDLRDANPEHFFMGNPVWTQPFILLEDDIFFLPIPGLLLSFCLELMEGLLDPHPALHARYESRRSSYLEAEVERLFRDAFPGAALYRGSQWKDGRTGQVFENDLFVVLDSFALIVEAKAGKVREAARRGAPDTVQRVIEDLLIAPAIQSARLAERLRDNPGVQRFDTRRGVIHEVDTSDVTRIVRLSVALDTPGTLLAYWPDLRDAGFIPPDTPLVPTLTLADLETIFALLESPLERLHYLVRRGEFEVEAGYKGDELDLLAFYLETGFAVTEAAASGARFLLYGQSVTLNPYLMRVQTGEAVPKPRRPLTPWWRDILTWLEERQVRRWTEMGLVLLNASYEEQVEFAQSAREVACSVADGRRPAGEDVLMYFSPPQRAEAIVVVAYGPCNPQERRELIRAASTQAASQAPITIGLAMGVSAEHPDRPFDVLVPFVGSATLPR